MVRRGGITEIPGSVIPPIPTVILRWWGVGGVHGKKKIKQLYHNYVQATHQFWGASLKAPWSYVCHKLESAIFLVPLPFLHVSSKKRCLQRLFTYHLKAHTISNKLVSKVSAQKKGKKSYDSYKYVLKFRWFPV